MRWHSLKALFILVSTMVAQQAFGAIDVEGIVVGLQSTAVVGNSFLIPGTVQLPAVFKIRLRVATNGKVLLLCLGPQSDFVAGNCAQPVLQASRDGTGQLRDGFGVVDTTQLLGKLLYIRNDTSGATATDVVQYTMTVE